MKIYGKLNVKLVMSSIMVFCSFSNLIFFIVMVMVNGHLGSLLERNIDVSLLGFKLKMYIVS